MTHRRRLAGALLLGLLAGLLLAPSAQGAVPWRVDPADLSPGQRRASDDLLAQALAKLPARWRQALPADLPVQWRDDLPPHVRGHARRGRLLLDKRLLRDWQARPVPVPEGDAATRAALATVIHELAHVLDRSPQGGLSRDARLRDLAGWQRRPLRPGRGDNAFRDRSPDLYELRRPAEFVAVNLEHFVLDPDYACRRPALAAWFRARVGEPSPTAACVPALPFLQADDDDGRVSLLALDPSRVYAVDYLLAEGNEQAMSLWGHSMLRLVICAPGRPRGPDCRMDLRYHRVLSFRAYVGDVQISSWRGLTGSYPSRLFVLPLNQVVDDYTQVELRSLASVPLRLSPDEIAALLERAGRVHWSYDGRYYFIGNNCAVETYKLLHDGVARLAALPLSGITPRGLLRRLARTGVADPSVLDDHAEATRRGYYFDSVAAHYQAMFDVLRARLPVPQRDVEQWLALEPAQRRAWLPQADLRSAAAMLLLEQAASRRQELRARDTLKRTLLRGPDAAAPRAALHELLAQGGLLARPASLLDGEGYGLPQAPELARLAPQLQARNADTGQGWQALRSQARAALPPRERAAMEGTEHNLAAIGQRLRELGAAGADLARP